MSVSHSRFGAVAVKLRSTRSSWTGGPGFLPLRAFLAAETAPPPVGRADPPHGPVDSRRGRRLGPHRPGTGSRTPGRRRGRRRRRWPGRPRRVRASLTGHGEPAVVGLAGELKDPARHRDGDPVGGELTDERVHHFPGRFACDRYAAARRSTSFSCSSSRIRLLRLAQLDRLGAGHAGPQAVLDIGLGQPVPQTRLADPEVLRDLRDPRPRLYGPPRTTSSRNSFGWGLGMVNILPAAPLRHHRSDVTYTSVRTLANGGTETGTCDWN